ncbi:MAG: hypothetical protein QM535_06755 [Limnohabitans sp.]|nr:hypothetical protein [Limnohabitans sp.]
MKKTFLILVLALTSNFGFTQWNPTGTSITSQIFRTGAVGIGYTALPTFSSFKFKVNGRSQIETGTLVIGADVTSFEENSNPNFWGIKSNKSILVQSSDPVFASIDVAGVGSKIVMAAVKCNGCYTKNGIVGDLVLRGQTSGSLIITNDSNGDIKLSTGNSGATPHTEKVQMRIDNIGNIGIGMGSSPIPATDKLAVNGLIHTKEVKVDLVGWPDYVFEKEYKLPTLEEVEKNIKEKGHLINVPSACEIESNGLLLGDISKKQQEKIEELTLYIIEQNKINEKQAKEIEELKVLVNKLIERK